MGLMSRKRAVEVAFGASRRSHSLRDSNIFRETEQPQGECVAARAYLMIDSSQREPNEVDHLRRHKGETLHPCV